MLHWQYLSKPTNSIFDLGVVDPVPDYSNIQKPIGDERDIDVRDERQAYLGFHNLNAILIPVLGGTIKYSGRWLNDKGKLDSSMVVQDSFFYQDFSYVLRSKLEIVIQRCSQEVGPHEARTPTLGWGDDCHTGIFQLYSGGDYGSKYDPNHIHDGSFVPTRLSRVLLQAQTIPWSHSVFWIPTWIQRRWNR